MHIEETVNTKAFESTFLPKLKLSENQMNLQFFQRINEIITANAPSDITTAIQAP